MQISIIIINYKTPSITVKCIAEIINALTKSLPYEIIIVDNNSGDNSREIITNAFPQVKWIQNKTNEGFGRANNLGVKHAQGKYILILNSDVYVMNDTIPKSITILESKQNAGLLGCELINPDGSDQSSRYSIASFRALINRNLLLDKLLNIKQASKPAIMGSYMLFKASVLKKFKGFDPDFFMYAEELELCHRLMQSGYDIVYTDAVRAIHEHGGSTKDISWAYKQRRLSQALLYYKIRGFWGYLLFHIILQFNFLTNGVLMWFLDKAFRQDYFRALKVYFSDIGYYLRIPFDYKRAYGSGSLPLKYKIKRKHE